MEINGKVYRNLEGQVQYLTDKYDDLQDQIIDVRAQIPSKMIVEELPEVGDPLITYYVGPKGTEPNQYYEVWVWVQEEPDGPFVWRELEDTDQVDLSGYLEKNTTATTYQQVYGKYTDGGQLMMNAAVGQVGNALVQRNASGQIYVPATPTEYDHAASKQYVDNNFVAKDTSTTPYSKAYVKKTDGTQDTLSMASTPNAGFIVQYNTGGTLRCKDPNGAGEEVVNLGYANDHYLAKQTGTSSYVNVYAKATDGSQVMLNVNGNPISDSIPFRFAYGHIKLPNQLTYPPTDDDYAVSKRYVDAVVGQLLYLHDLDVIVNVDATNKLFIKAYLINGSPTAITSFDRILYKRIDIQWGGFGPNSYDATPVAVTKLPDGFRQSDFEEPLIGFLYQYISGGNLVSAQTTNIMTTTITDVVTTW